MELHVYKAINEVTAAMAAEGISKSQRNSAQGYQFRGIDDIYAALSRPLSNAKLCMLPRVVESEFVERPTKNGGVATHVRLTVEFDMVSAIDGSKHVIRVVGEAMDSADKSSNKAMSAAMKYACLLAFQIPTEGDNDADASHHETTDLSRPLAASIEWVQFEKDRAAALKSAKTMGELNEAWSGMYHDAQRSPNGTLGRLTAVKDARKLELSAAR